MFGRHRAPVWFVLLLGLSEALLLRWLSEAHGAGVPSATPAPPLSLAFWSLFILVAGWIWKGVEVAGRLTLQALAWSVQALWAFAKTIANAASAVGKAVIAAGKGVWDFFVLTYEKVLKPVALKFVKFVRWAEKWGERIFTPIFEFLDKIRGWVLRVYNDYVRPVLDIIDVTRRALRILASLGVDWARALDQKLAQLEEKIQQPFTFALQKINEIVGVLNRVVTLDGLLQRVALIRSLERDIRYAARALNNWRSAPFSASDDAALKASVKTLTVAQAETQAHMHITGTGGRRAGLVNEMVQHWTNQVERQP